MTNYHINKRGIPAPCRAKNGNCPLGGAFGSKAEASVTAEKEITNYLSAQDERETKLNADMKEAVLNGNISTAENLMENQSAKSVEGAYKVVQAVRNENPNIKVTLNKLTGEISELKHERSKLRKSIVEKSMENSPYNEKIQAEQKEIERLQKKIEGNRAAADEANSGNCPKCGEGQLVKKSGRNGDFIACNNFPKCKHTQNVAIPNEKTLKAKIETAEQKIKSHKYQMEFVEPKELIENNKKINELNEKIKPLENKEAIAKYIYDHENPKPSFKGHKPKPETTPIEKYYETRKAADEKIEKQIGKNKLSINSGSLKFGKNAIEEELSVDSKGRISNLYLEYSGSKGEIKRVVKIHNSGTNNIEFEDGSFLTISRITNWKMDRGPAQVPSAYNFYSTPPRGSKRYEGFREIIVHDIDSSDY